MVSEAMVGDVIFNSQWSRSQPGMLAQMMKEQLMPDNNQYLVNKTLSIRPHLGLLPKWSDIWLGIPIGWPQGQYIYCGLLLRNRINRRIETAN